MELIFKPCCIQINDKFNPYVILWLKCLVIHGQLPRPKSKYLNLVGQWANCTSSIRMTTASFTWLTLARTPLEINSIKFEKPVQMVNWGSDWSDNFPTKCPFCYASFWDLKRNLFSQKFSTDVSFNAIRNEFWLYSKNKYKL